MINKKIIEYIDKIKLNCDSIKKRNETIQSIKRIIENKYKNTSVILYGSYPQNLSTVFSELDFTVKTNENIDLLNITNTLRCELDIVKIVGKSVPIIKAKYKKTYI